MRCFIAVKIPEELKEKILEVQKKLERTGADLKLVEKENLHFTIKFLGEISEKQVEEVKTFLTSLKEKAFEISVAGLGVFPNENYMRTIWLGIKEKLFLELIKKVEDGLSKIRKEQHELNSHLTLARVKTAKNKEKLKTSFTELKNTEIGKMKVKALELMASELTPKGPRYRVLQEFKLK